jgi:hypothetical protein
MEDKLRKLCRDSTYSYSCSLLLLLSTKPSQLCSFPSLDVILANPELPERNGDVMIFPFLEYQMNNKVLNGYTIEFQDQDIRFTELEEEAFVAWHIGGGEVVVKYPSMPWSFLYEEAKDAKARNDGGMGDQQLMVSPQVTRTAVLNERDTSHLWKYLLIRFDEPLDNKLLSPESEGGLIDIYPMPIPFTLNGKLADGSDCTLTGPTRINIAFPIALDTDHHPETKKKSKEKNRLAAKTRDVISGMSNMQV